MQIIQYSKLELLNYLTLLNGKFYILFYDLDTILFDRIVIQFSSLISNAEYLIFDNVKCDKLVISGKFIINSINNLVDKLDDLDVGEFEITEFNKGKELTNFSNELEFKSYVKNSVAKSIYVNKDEQVIQLYNF